MCIRRILMDQAGADGGAAGGGVGTAAAATTTTATTGATTTAATTTATTSTAASFDWKSAGVDEVGQALVSERQWKGPGDLLASYRNLEKLVGVPAEQVIKLPKDMNDATMGDVWTRLGKPSAATDYKLPVPEGDKGEFAGAASKWFHEANLTVGQAQKVAAAWNAHQAEATKAQQTAYTQKVDGEARQLKTDWGAQHDSNVAIAKSAAQKFGMTAEQINALESAMGFAGVHKFLFNIGAKLGEAEFVDGNPGGGFGGRTPESARAEIARMKADPTFSQRFVSKDPVVKGQARKEMDDLMRIAYPGQSTL
jgi:hypothetical protein